MKIINEEYRAEIEKIDRKKRREFLKKKIVEQSGRSKNGKSY